jgi:hypothetical protein
MVQNRDELIGEHLALSQQLATLHTALDEALRTQIEARTVLTQAIVEYEWGDLPVLSPLDVAREFQAEGARQRQARATACGSWLCDQPRAKQLRKPVSKHAMKAVPGGT